MPGLPGPPSGPAPSHLRQDLRHTLCSQSVMGGVVPPPPESSFTRNLRRQLYLEIGLCKRDGDEVVLDRGLAARGTQTRGQACEDGGRGWPGASTSQGLLAPSGSQRCEEGRFPRFPRGDTAPYTLVWDVWPPRLLENTLLWLKPPASPSVQPPP